MLAFIKIGLRHQIFILSGDSDHCAPTDEPLLYCRPPRTLSMAPRTTVWAIIKVDDCEHRLVLVSCQHCNVYVKHLRFFSLWFIILTDSYLANSPQYAWRFVACSHKQCSLYTWFFPQQLNMNGRECASGIYGYSNCLFVSCKACRECHQRWKEEGHKSRQMWRLKSQG